MLQILWERGWIDVALVKNPHPMRYSKGGKKDELDEEGNIKHEFEQYSLTNLLSKY